MNVLTQNGRKRYEILRPKWIKDFLPEEFPVETSEQLYEEVRKVLKEQMINQKKVCTAFGFIPEEDEIKGAEEGFYSITVVEEYSYEKLLERFDRQTTKSKLTAVRMVFEPHCQSEDLTWIIIVCNN